MYIDTKLHDANRVPLPVQKSGSLRAADVRLLCFTFLAIIDSAIVFLGLFATTGLGSPIVTGTPLYANVILASAFPCIAFSFGAYSHGSITSIAAALSALTKAFAILLLLVVYPVLLHNILAQSLGWELVFAITTAYVVTCLVHFGFVQFVHWSLHDRILKRFLIIDSDEKCPHLEGHIVVDAKGANLQPKAIDPEMLARIGIALSGADRIVVHCSVDRRENWAMVLKGLGIDGAILAPDLANLGIRDSDIQTGAAFLVVSKGPLDLRNRVLKRLLDLAISIPLLILFAVPMIIIALLIRIETSGPALFRQPRIGQHNKPFEILKFRTMRQEACDTDGQQSTARADDRITKLGAWLRRSSVDELPQLMNVLHGDMSMVGPRPHAKASRAEDKLFWEIDRRYFVRHSVKPGITGLAQVMGLRGATERTDDLVKRLRADLTYSSNWSVWADISILVRTLRVVVHSNAY